AVARDQLTNAIQHIEIFLTANPKDTSADLLRLTAGELQLKRFYQLIDNGAESGTNRMVLTHLLEQTRAELDRVITNFPNSTWTGRAWLNRGWSLWEQARLTGEAGPLLEGQSAFEQAMARLPASEQQATARFKLADCQFQRK